MGALDYTVLIGYLLIVATIGFWASRRQRTTEDYFLGSHSIPWWAAGLSIIATETSALTFLGAPTQSMRGDWTYIQLAFGSILARFVVAGVLIGAYYKARVFTVYGYLEQRFGVWSRGLASTLFFIGRSLGSGVRLYGAAIAVSVVFGDQISFPGAIAMIATVAVLYTIAGGIRSVIWTDMVQGILLFGGGLIALIYLLVNLDVGIAGFFEQVAAGHTPPVAGETHSKLRMFNLSLDPSQAYTLIGGIIGASFLTMATHGTDQDMIQRALTCKDAQGGRKSLWLSAALNLPIVILFLMIGSALWLYYGPELPARAAEHARLAGESDPNRGYDYVFLFYVLENLPAGLKGLIVAAVFAAAMSSLDSAIAALSSTAVKCVWQPYIAKDRDEAYYLRASRSFAIGFGVLLAGIAVYVWQTTGSGGQKEGFGVLMLGLKVLTWIFPPLLGVFFVGVFTRRGSDLGNVLAISVGVGLLLWVEPLDIWKYPPLLGVLFVGFFRRRRSDLLKALAVAAGVGLLLWVGRLEVKPWAWVWNSMIGCLVSFAVSVSFTATNQEVTA